VPKDFAKYTITAEEENRGRKEMIEIENNARIEDKITVGDASESGLIKFAQPIRDLDDERAKIPIF